MWQLLGIPCVHATKSMYFIVLPLKPRKIPGRPRKKRIRAICEGGSSTRVSKVGVVVRPRNKQSVDDLEDVDVIHRGLMRDEGAGRSRGGTRGSRGGSSMFGGTSGSTGKGAGRFGGASGSRGRGAGGSKRKPISTAGTQKRKGKKNVGTSGFVKWFGLQDELE
uniref:Uncharacterized protein n=1 Tax=Tanacetum cinerariifolium TaxID=118510 RepID=A0A6L2NA80_TANCI|nr:hypothetical protein [Tanacetum cinerariifolium]